MKFAFYTLGCKLNFAESSDIARRLRERGFLKAAAGEHADVVLLNTCSVTDIADHKGRQAIHRLKRQYPDALLVVTGCYAQLKADEVAAIDGVDLVLGASEKADAAEQIIKKLGGQKLLANRGGKPAEIYTSDIRKDAAFHPARSFDDRTRCFLKVQDGCDYFCTYCTIPMARGISRSATVKDTIEEVRKAIADGAKEIVITGVNTGDFGRRNGENLLQLLTAMDAINGQVRYRISSVEPNLLSDDIIDFVAGSKHFAPHFHIPLQSGSDDVLRIMRRRYTISLFAQRVDKIRSLMPHAFIGVDVIVGVRGETEQHFINSQQFIESLPVSQLHVFTYSERAGTAMLDMDGCIVPHTERKRRSQVLHMISEQKLKEFYEVNKGRSATVLWEAKRDKGLMAGFTENYVRVTRAYDKGRVNAFEEIII